MKSKALAWSVFVLLALSLASCSNYDGVFQKPRIRDGMVYGRRAFPEPDKAPYRFSENGGNIKLPKLESWADKKAIKKFDSPEEFFENSRTTAFLVVRNDTILYENYFNGYTDTTITQVFSVTKPLTASLLSKALEEKLIPSIDEPVQNYFPVRKRKDKAKMLTLRHLAMMQSGLNHSDYFRLAKVVRLYHAKNVDHYIRKAKVFRTPGKQFKYKSIDTQVLGACLENIFGESRVYDEFLSLYWHPIRPEYKGYFSVDNRESNNLKYYGGLNMSARDLAKIGKMYLQGGRFDGVQVIPEFWMEMVRDKSAPVGKFDYNLGWYFDEAGEGRNIYYGAGFNGQFLVINEDTNVVLVRFGEAKAGHNWYHILSDLTTLFK